MPLQQQSRDLDQVFGCPALATDLYQLTMAQAYWLEVMDETAVFDLFVRELPPGRHFLIAAGLEHALNALESFHFTERDLEYLESLGMFRREFLADLAGLRFRGEVYALPEGTPVFPAEPLLEVEAPLAQAQLVETTLINQLHLPTLVASKTALLLQAARGRPVVDFGLRRAHGIEAGVKAARAAYLAGAASSSDLLAGRSYGLPVAGTMAHSYVLAHDDELESFRRFAEIYPQTVLLVDTYDTLDGVRKVVELSRELGRQFRVRGIRIDSGDLATLSREARNILDRAGLEQVSIFASGDLDEKRIADLVQGEAPLDAFGVGTHLVTSADAPFLNCAYKLVEYAGVPRMKLSSGKATLPGRKQIFRRRDNARYAGDLIARHDETHPGERMLQRVMSEGRRVAQTPDLGRAREYCRAQIASLPVPVIEGGADYTVTISADLRQETAQVQQGLKASPPISPDGP
jgi:nicotinate phosphoribosyltransferase